MPYRIYSLILPRYCLTRLSIDNLKLKFLKFTKKSLKVRSTLSCTQTVQLAAVRPVHSLQLEWHLKRKICSHFNPNLVLVSRYYSEISMKIIYHLKQ